MIYSLHTWLYYSIFLYSLYTSLFLKFQYSSSLNSLKYIFLRASSDPPKSSRSMHLPVTAVTVTIRVVWVFVKKKSKAQRKGKEAVPKSPGLLSLAQFSMRWLYCPAPPPLPPHTHSERSPFRAFFLFVDLFDVRFPFRRFVSPLPSCSVSLALPFPPPRMKSSIFNILPSSILLSPISHPSSRGFARSWWRECSAYDENARGKRGVKGWRWKTGAGKG